MKPKNLIGFKRNAKSLVGLGVILTTAVWTVPDSVQAQVPIPTPFIPKIPPCPGRTVCATNTGADGNADIAFLTIDTSGSPSTGRIGFFEDVITLGLTLDGLFFTDDPRETRRPLLILASGDLQVSQITAEQIVNNETDPTLSSEAIGLSLGDLLKGEIPQRDISNFRTNGGVKFQATFGSSPGTLTRFFDINGDSDVNDIDEQKTQRFLGNPTKFTFFVPLPSSNFSAFVKDLSNLNQFSRLQAVLTDIQVPDLPADPDAIGASTFGFGINSEVKLFDSKDIPESSMSVSIVGFGVLSASLLLKRKKML